MSKKPILAILYDFDSTLSPTDMQAYGFIPAMGMSPEDFWGRCGEFAKKTGCEKILSYLYTMVEVAKERGIPLTRQFLNDCGKGIQFYPGVTTWFKRINEYGESKGVKVEHYIISSGNKEILEGCAIASEFKRMFGCEFVYGKNGEVLWPKMAINYTQKTQFFYRISKGALDTSDDDSVNQKVASRRVPYSNIVYIGDGMTDVPAMLIAKNSGGRSIAVYKRGNEDRVASLKDDGRVNYLSVADYSSGKRLERIMRVIIDSVAIREQMDYFEGQDPISGE